MVWMVEHVRRLFKDAGLRYDYYVEVAESIVKELKTGTLSEEYVKEKTRKLHQMFEDIRYEMNRQKILREENLKYGEVTSD